MKCFLSISLCILAALALFTNVAASQDKSSIYSSARRSKDTRFPASVSEESASGSLESNEVNRAKRTLGVDRNVKKEFEFKTKHGTTIKFSKSTTYNDGGGLTMLPVLIDSIGSNRRKLIYALRGYKYRNCIGCGWGVSSAENNGSSGDDNLGSGINTAAPAQTGGQLGGLGGANAEAGAEAWDPAQINGGSLTPRQPASSAVASSQASTQASSQAEESAVASSQASAQASSLPAGNTVTSSQASAEATVGGSDQVAPQAVAPGGSEITCEIEGCAGGIIGGSIQSPVEEIAQGGGWKAGGEGAVGDSGSEGAHVVEGWSNGCTGDYTGYGSSGCICSQMMPVLLQPQHHYPYASPFHHLIKRHIRSRIRTLVPNYYATNSLCAS